MIVVDGHLDLAWNALVWNRDLRLSALETRQLEAGMPEKGRGTGTVGLPELRRGEVALVLATLFARTSWPWSGVSGHRSGEIAYAHARGQLAYYEALAAAGAVRLVADRAALGRHLADWAASANRADRAAPDAVEPPPGLVLCMEGADPILSPDRLPEWWAAGLRVVGLAHYGVSAYAHGTGAPGGLRPAGRGLLRALDEAGFVLDVTHLAEQAFYEALDTFGGRVLASHSNCRALVPGDRQISDDMIRALVQRQAVIGAVLDGWMLYPGWVSGQTSNEVISLQDYVDHLDHVCQVAGSARHAAIGSDLDGGFGTEQCPRDLETIADLQRVGELLRARGYAASDVELILHGNWLRLLGEALPAG